ncbi:MAG: hypothetical protein IBX48_02415 [Thiomicrospira sp.]|uniref:hypothetical protein n=1 Tax=Thiomicrospira sp. TaxID=935 RepID=UPI0019DD44A3|nr:hypothetical protein [Thiomicrospira sp.]MBE0493171.1 hypothetical protein [Thiomicrospira sp.]
MTMQIKGHAAQIVENFKALLNEQQMASLTDEPFEELETLIDASLSVVYSQAQHDFAKELEVMAHKLRKGSSHISET